MKISNRLGILVLMAGVVMATWAISRSIDHVPLRLATHFDAGGKADGWMDRDRFRISMGAAMAALSLFLILVTLLIRHLPDRFINLPNRQFWFSPQRRDEAFAAILDFGMAAAGATLWLFSMLYREVIRANETPGALFSPSWQVMTLSMLIIGVGLIRLWMKFASTPASR